MEFKKIRNKKVVLFGLILFFCCIGVFGGAEEGKAQVTCGSFFCDPLNSGVSHSGNSICANDLEASPWSWCLSGSKESYHMFCAGDNTCINPMISELCNNNCCQIANDNSYSCVGNVCTDGGGGDKPCTTAAGGACAGYDGADCWIKSYSGDSMCAGSRCKHSITAAINSNCPAALSWCNCQKYTDCSIAIPPAPSCVCNAGSGGSCASGGCSCGAAGTDCVGDLGGMCCDLSSNTCSSTIAGATGCGGGETCCNTGNCNPAAAGTDCVGDLGGMCCDLSSNTCSSTIAGATGCGGGETCCNPGNCNPAGPPPVCVPPCVPPEWCSAGVCVDPAGPSTVWPVTFTNPLDADSFEELIANVINWLLAIVGSIVLLFIIIAGIMYMTAAGDEAQLTRAKKMLFYTILGFAIILISYSLIKEIKDILGIVS